jgi:alpha-mannosidase
VTTVDKTRAPAGSKGDYYGDASKESVNLAFPFDVEGGQVRMELPIGGVIRPDIEQIARSCKNWFTMGNWTDVSAPGRGVTLISLDAPLLQVGGLTANLLNSQSDPRVWRASVGSSTSLYPWLMNNHWGTNYRAYQEGPVTFRFAVRPHQGYDPAAATRAATGMSQPLLVLPAAEPAPTGEPRLRLSTEDIVVTGLKPADDGGGWIVRLYNASGKDARVSLAWSRPAPSVLRLSDTSERPGAVVGGPVPIPAWGVVTLRAER